MEEIDVIKDAPLEAPGEHSVRSIHMLDSVMLQIARELIVVQEAPG